MNKSLGVFCASSLGASGEYERESRNLISLLTQQPGWDVVYGGAKVGLMGVVADAALRNGASVTGVLPTCLRGRELEHEGLTELIFVETMHQRKALIAERSTAFLALPGGFGTYDEIFEMITWNQLRIHNKRCVFFNFDGFYDGIKTQTQHARTQGFLRGGIESVYFCDTAQDVIKTLCS